MVPKDIHSVEDIINFTETFYPAEECTDHDIGEFLWTEAEGLDVDNTKYEDVVGQEPDFVGKEGILGAMEKDKLDFLLTLSALGVANDLAANMEYLVITVPLAFHLEGTAIEHESGRECIVEAEWGTSKVFGSERWEALKDLNGQTTTIAS